jgi:hypothetical protein
VCGLIFIHIYMCACVSRVVSCVVTRPTPESIKLPTHTEQQTTTAMNPPQDSRLCAYVEQFDKRLGVNATVIKRAPANLLVLYVAGVWVSAYARGRDCCECY